VGCNLALLFPPTAGYLFTRVGPMSIWYFNLMVTAVQAAAAAYLLIVLRNVKLKSDRTEEEENRDRIEMAEAKKD
jgi:hypothetical protein